MEERDRRLPWLTAGDRVALVLLFSALVVLLGIHWALRTGLGTPDAELARSATVRSHTVDLNRAPWWELQALRGLGETRAKQIVDYRRRHGPFGSVDELVKVPGVGPKTLARLRPHLNAGAPERPHEPTR